MHDLYGTIVGSVRNSTVAFLTMMICILAPAADTWDACADTSQQAA